jgi:2-octaprenyl-6-methoxyphenol hydroxylase
MRTEREAGGSDPHAIAIIGAGPVGLVLALLLARRKVSSVVLDARSLDLACADRRLLALSRGTVQTLAPLVSLPPVSTAAIRSVVVSSQGDFGRVVIDERDVGGAMLGLTIRYGELLAPLAAAAEAEPRIRVLRPYRVSSVRQDSAHAFVDIENEPTLRAALVVNAEGLRAEASPARQVALVGDLRIEAVPGETAFERFTSDGPLALLPVAAKEFASERTDSGAMQTMAMVWCMSPEQAERRSLLDASALKAELQQAFGRQGRILGLGKCHRVELPEQARTGLREHRIAYLGNAAQTLHPVAGQGLNLGIRDCVALAEVVALACSAGRDPASTLASFDHGRRADRAAILAITRNAPQIFATRFAPLALGRSLALSTLGIVPDLRREFARLLMFGVRG